MENIFVFFVVGAAMAWAVGRFFLKRKTHAGCGSSCAGCRVTPTLVTLSRKRR
jgi:hypothetical protein